MRKTSARTVTLGAHLLGCTPRETIAAIAFAAREAPEIALETTWHGAGDVDAVVLEAVRPDGTRWARRIAPSPESIEDAQGGTRARTLALTFEHRGTAQARIATDLAIVSNSEADPGEMEVVTCAPSRWTVPELAHLLDALAERHRALGEPIEKQAGTPSAAALERAACALSVGGADDEGAFIEALVHAHITPRLRGTARYEVRIEAHGETKVRRSMT